MLENSHHMQRHDAISYTYCSNLLSSTPRKFSAHVLRKTNLQKTHEYTHTQHTHTHSKNALQMLFTLSRCQNPGLHPSWCSLSTFLCTPANPHSYASFFALGSSGVAAGATTCSSGTSSSCIKLAVASWNLMALVL